MSERTCLVMVKLLVVIMLIKLVSTLRVLQNQRRNVDRVGNNKSNVLSQLLSSLSGAGHPKRSRRTNNIASLYAQSPSSRLSKHLSGGRVLRTHDDEDELVTERFEAVNAKDEQAEVIEHELLDALHKHSSALLDRPYLEHKGKNDFLVMGPDVQDPFVTVIPNAIHYSIEKKCVNWLDDCSLQGIRARLLNKISFPH